MTTSGTTLCTSCGLCCSGALFARATLRPEEVAWARGKRLLDVRSDGPPEPSFALPCDLLRERKCTAYEERPQVCRAFRCKVLQSLEAGELTFEAAQSKVARMQMLFERVGALVSPSSVEALLDLGELEALAERDFRDAPPPPSAPPSTETLGAPASPPSDTLSAPAPKAT